MSRQEEALSSVDRDVVMASDASMIGFVAQRGRALITAAAAIPDSGETRWTAFRPET